MESITDELREFVTVLHRLGYMGDHTKEQLDAIADRIDVAAEDEVAYALAQQRNTFYDEDGSIRYAHDVGFDEGYQAAKEEHDERHR